MAQGEGQTVMILITRAYGPDDGATNALNRFKEIFGEYYAQGAEVSQGLSLNKSYVNQLISDQTRKNLMTWISSDPSPMGVEYFASLHVNFS